MLEVINLSWGRDARYAARFEGDRDFAGVTRETIQTVADRGVAVYWNPGHKGELRETRLA